MNKIMICCVLLAANNVDAARTAVQPRLDGTIPDYAQVNRPSDFDNDENEYEDVDSLNSSLASGNTSKVTTADQNDSNLDEYELPGQHYPIPVPVQGGDDDVIYAVPVPPVGRRSTAPEISRLPRTNPRESRTSLSVGQRQENAYETPRATLSSTPRQVSPPVPTSRRPTQPQIEYEQPVREYEEPVRDYESVVDAGVEADLQELTRKNISQMTSGDIRRVKNDMMRLQEESAEEGLEAQQLEQEVNSFWKRLQKRFGRPSRAVAPQAAASQVVDPRAMALQIDDQESLSTFMQNLVDFQREYAKIKSTFQADYTRISRKAFLRKYQSLIASVEQLRVADHAYNGVIILQKLLAHLTANPTINMRLQQLGRLKIGVLESAMDKVPGTLLGSSVKSSTSLSQLNTAQLNTVFDAIFAQREYLVDKKSMAYDALVWLGTPGIAGGEALNYIKEILQYPYARTQIPLIFAGKPINTKLLDSFEDYYGTYKEKIMQDILQVHSMSQV